MAKPFPLSILMKLEDRASGPLRRFTNRLGGPRVNGALDRAKTRLGGMGRALGVVAGGYALVGSAAVAGMGAVSKIALGFANRGDSIAKTAQRLGLGVEALQELHYAADRNGVAAATFDMAYQRFARRIGEAAAGSGEARTAIEALDIALFDQNGQLRDSEDLFSEVADKLSTLENASVRNALAMKFFDSEGVALVQMMKDGSAGISDLRREAQELGLVMSSDLVEQSEGVVDKWTQVIARAQALGNALAGPFLDLADHLFPKIGEALQRIRPWLEDILNQSQQRFPRILSLMADFGAKLWEITEPARELWTNVTRLLDQLDSRYNVLEKFWKIFAVQAEIALWPVMRLMDALNWLLETAGLLDDLPERSGVTISEFQLRREESQRKSPLNAENLERDRQNQLTALERLGVVAGPPTQGDARVRVELGPGLKGQVQESSGLDLMLDTGAMMPAGG